MAWRSHVAVIIWKTDNTSVSAVVITSDSSADTFGEYKENGGHDYRGRCQTLLRI